MEERNFNFSIKLGLFSGKHSKKVEVRYNAFEVSKGLFISKANCQALNSSKDRTNEFGFTSMGRGFVCFLEEIEDSKKAFRNYLTFTTWS